MSLSQTEYERIAVAAALAAGCRPCSDHHLAAARRAGVEESAIEAAIASAGCVATAASARMRAYALGQAAPESCCDGGDRVAELVALGAALALANHGEVAKHATAAVAAGATAGEIAAVSELARAMRGNAAKHALAALAGVVEPEAGIGMAGPCCATEPCQPARWSL